VLRVETRATYFESGFQSGDRPVAPGPYMTLSITDSGVGMTREVMSQIFQPFFTTKEAGKGTGLGLATCQGIVEQAGGHITVTSQPGEGATFAVHLPRTSKRPPQTYIHASATLPHGNETLLLVEDEEVVRRASIRMLRSLGYEVLEAADAAQAQAILAERANGIRLLITDVVLPGTTGRELAEQVANEYPAIKILFASGYSDDVILQHRLLSHHVALLPKPYTINALANKIREVLDAPPNQR
jgi:two-component system cell cycle sensor histidine kinase/response regulator CckA